MMRASLLQLSAIGLAGVALIAIAYQALTSMSTATDPPYASVRHFGKPADLPRPSSLPLREFEGKLFSYLLDYEEDFFRANSSQTYGGILSGAIPLGRGTKLSLRASYARQFDYRDNPFDYAADYWSFEAGSRPGVSPSRSITASVLLGSASWAASGSA